MSVKKKAEQAKREMTASSPLRKELTDADFLSLPVTLLNLECHGKVGGGIAKGLIYHLCGRKEGGKTFIANGLLAEAARNPAFDDYELVYDDIERGGVLLGVEQFFGAKLARRILAPAYNAKTRKPAYSFYVSDFIKRLTKKLEAGKKVVWIADSLDALTGDPWMQSKMTDGKAKSYSQDLRRLVDPLYDTGSILILISQSRVSMGATMFDEDIFAGGRALDHYPTLRIELRKAKTLKKTLKGLGGGVKYTVGSIIKAVVKKNRVSGAVGNPVYFPFDPKYGIDNIAANTNYLVHTKHWKTEKSDDEEYDLEYEEDRDKLEGKIFSAPEFDFIGKGPELIAKIEREGLERELEVLVGKVWHQIQSSLTIERKPRYE